MKALAPTIRPAPIDLPVLDVNDGQALPQARFRLVRPRVAGEGVEFVGGEIGDTLSHNT